MSIHPILFYGILVAAFFVGAITAKLAISYQLRRLRKRLEWMTAVANGEHLKVVKQRRK